jgi:membrane fusion protein (multidrug efflux system)
MTEPRPNNTRKTGLLLLTGLFLIIGVIVLILAFLSRNEIDTDDAYVNGNTVQLMSQIPGTVMSINTDDTQLVLQGQALIQLDPTDANIALLNAQAKLADTVRQVKQIFENAQGALAALVLSETQLKKAKLDVNRRKGLVGESAVSREEFQHIQTDYQAAKARYDIARHNFKSLQSLVEKAHLYTHPRVEQAKAEFKVSFLNAKRTTLFAPTTGYVAKRTVQVGQQIMPNVPLLSIIPLQ